MLLKSEVKGLKFWRWVLCKLRGYHMKCVVFSQQEGLSVREAYCHACHKSMDKPKLV